MGIITDIQHFSTGDGPGIRTTIFTKGCNLRCPWCHNPETISGQRQLMFFDRRCSGCRVCEQICSWGAHTFTDGIHNFKKQKCAGCFKCTEYCCTDALKLCGREADYESIMFEILRDMDFYTSSGGGVTISGGEPLLQVQFCAEILAACRKYGIHTMVDTAGNVDFTDFEKIIEYTDIFYFDFKSADEKLLNVETGADLGKTAGNLRELYKHGCEVVVRVPVIPDFNDSADEARKIAELIKDAGAVKVNLLPFHRLGTSKYAALGLKYSYEQIPIPSSDKLNGLLTVFEKAGLSAVLDG